ncbi:MAG: hypothetical protein ACLPV2_04760 [Steroidobacteraceae bacterium]
MRREKAAVAHAVLPIDRHGNWVCVPGAYVVHWTRIGAVELYLKYRKRGVPPHDQAAFDTLERTVLELLTQVVAGADPAEVFQFKQREKQGRPTRAHPEAMCLEALRLQFLHDFDPARAKDEVAKVFDVEVRTVERALKKFGNTPMYSKENIRNYERNLRLRKLLV